MDFWHRLGRIIRKSNLGTLIFFVLNIAMLFLLLFPEGVTKEEALILVGCYAISIIISISPLGEWAMTFAVGGREIKRNDIKLKIIPLLDVVYEKAKEKTPGLVKSIRLKIINDDTPNAFAIGRKTICVTSGLLKLSDDDIMGVLAHEMGHIAYRHSVIQLLIGGGNVFISGCLLIIKITCWAISGLLTIISFGAKNYLAGVISVALGAFSTFLIWLWTKFCMLFLMWSMRQNEYIADEYAFRIGFGNELASVLDREICDVPKIGLLKALYSTHPSNDDRIAKLQELGATYSQYLSIQ